MENQCLRVSLLSHAQQLVQSPFATCTGSPTEDGGCGDGEGLDRLDVDTWTLVFSELENLGCVVAPAWLDFRGDVLGHASCSVCGGMISTACYDTAS